MAQGPFGCVRRIGTLIAWVAESAEPTVGNRSVVRAPHPLTVTKSIVALWAATVPE
jgi:hypothetical protein